MDDILKGDKIKELSELLKEASERDLRLLIYHAIKEILRREQDAEGDDVRSKDTTGGASD